MSTTIPRVHSGDSCKGNRYRRLPPPELFFLWPNLSWSLELCVLRVRYGAAAVPKVHATFPSELPRSSLPIDVVRPANGTRGQMRRDTYNVHGACYARAEASQRLVAEKVDPVLKTKNCRLEMSLLSPGTRTPTRAAALPAMCPVLPLEICGALSHCTGGLEGGGGGGPGCVGVAVVLSTPPQGNWRPLSHCVRA